MKKYSYSIYENKIELEFQGKFDSPIDGLKFFLGECEEAYGKPWTNNAEATKNLSCKLRKHIHICYHKPTPKEYEWEKRKNEVPEIADHVMRYYFQLVMDKIDDLEDKLKEVVG